MGARLGGETPGVGGSVLRLLSSRCALRGGIKPAVVFCLCSAPSLQSSEVSRPAGLLLSSVCSRVHGLIAAKRGEWGTRRCSPPPPGLSGTRMEGQRLCLWCEGGGGLHARVLGGAAWGCH